MTGPSFSSATFMSADPKMFKAGNRWRGWAAWRVGRERFWVSRTAFDTAVGVKHTVRYVCLKTRAWLHDGPSTLRLPWLYQSFHQGLPSGVSVRTGCGNTTTALCLMPRRAGGGSGGVWGGDGRNVTDLMKWPAPIATEVASLPLN